MRCAIAIFAKTIGLSPVKTRLAADVGTANAEAFYRQSVKAVEAVVREAGVRKPDFTPYWVLAEKEAVDREEWRVFPALWSGEGGLGQRLANVSEYLFDSHEAVMFIGTDSPQIQSASLLEALDVLEQNPERCVAGPAEDGGFYLFVSRNPLPREIWEAIEYSVSTTLSELETQIIEVGGSMLRLRTEQDVDTVEDLATLKRELMKRNFELLPEQKQLMGWLENYFCS